MKTLNWIILGASSPIAKAFARVVASQSHSMILVGRTTEDLQITSNDIKIRYGISCTPLTLDLAKVKSLDTLFSYLQKTPGKSGIFIAHTISYQNDELEKSRIRNLLNTNVNTTIELIHRFVFEFERSESLIYLSSVAGDRGRGNNSLYGGSKKIVETYLDGLKVTQKKVSIHSPRLGFIDTPQTFGKAGVFLARSPKQCAQFCLSLLNKKCYRRYYPWFWRYIMLVIKLIPEKLFNRLKL